MMRKKMLLSTDIRPPSGKISQASIRILRRDAEKLLRKELGGVSNEIIEYAVNRQQVVTPVVLEREFIRVWAARYRGAIQRAAVSYAEVLARLIGSTKGLGRNDLVWIRREAAAFLRTHISSRASEHFVAGSLTGVAEIQADADIFFNRVLAEYGKAPLIKPVRNKLSDAQELYGRTKKNLRNAETLNPTPAQKVGNPEAFPLMNAKEIAAYFGVTRSTVARWADEGKKLKRVGMGKTTGKRARLLITTKSVKKLSQESPE
jgi:hypothetical protein